MATALLQPPTSQPRPEILPPENPDVRQYDVEIRSAARNYRQSILRIGYYGARMRATEGWRGLGFESEDSYRESLEVPRSTWHKSVRICEAFASLSLGELESFKITNLQLLLGVNPGILQDYRWLEEAQRLKPKQLAELVAERNRSVGDEREPLTNYTVRIPFLAKRAIEQQVEDYRKKHELSSPGQALELMIADRQGEAGEMTDLFKVRRLLSGIAQSLQTKANRCPLEQERSWLKLAMEIVDESYQKAVSAARQKSEGDTAD